MSGDKKPTLGETMLEALDRAKQQTVFPLLHAALKPVFDEYPDLVSVGFSTETHWDDERDVVYPLDESLITFNYTEEGVEKEVDQDNDGDWYVEEESEQDEIKADSWLFSAADMVRAVASEFDRDQTALIFGVNGEVLVNRTSVEVSGEYMANDNF